jgi:hypothetical protein
MLPATQFSTLQSMGTKKSTLQSMGTKKSPSQSIGAKKSPLFVGCSCLIGQFVLPYAQPKIIVVKNDTHDTNFFIFFHFMNMIVEVLTNKS